MTQLYHIAKRQLPIGDLSAAYTSVSYDYSILWPNKVGNFRDPLTEELIESSGDKDFPGHKVGKLKKKITCFLCRKEGRFKAGSNRVGRAGQYRLYAKNSKGCQTCNVPLCKNFNCWKDYHSGEFAGRSDLMSEECWEK